MPTRYERKGKKIEALQGKRKKYEHPESPVKRKGISVLNRFGLAKRTKVEFN